MPAYVGLPFRDECLGHHKRGKAVFEASRESFFRKAERYHRAIFKWIIPYRALYAFLQPLTRALLFCMPLGKFRAIT